MSIIDLDRLSPPEVIAQYVIHCKPAGFFLSFAEYQLIDTWLSAIDDNDELLLLILSELLPRYYEQQSPLKRQSSLQFFHKSVMRKIAEIKSRQ
jgi:hypothetical protein